jgi:hypothetical protein
LKGVRSPAAGILPQASQVAPQRRNGFRPLILVTRFSCAEVDSQSTELRGARGLGRASINFGAPRDLKIHEARRYHRCLKLCVQQSTRDSTFPEIDILLAFLRHCFLYEDIADLKTAARLENPRHLLESGELIGKEV